MENDIMPDLPFMEKVERTHQSVIPTLWYGGVMGVPLWMFPDDAEDGDIVGGIRRVKSKKLI